MKVSKMRLRNAHGVHLDSVPFGGGQPKALSIALPRKPTRNDAFDLEHLRRRQRGSQAECFSIVNEFQVFSEFYSIIKQHLVSRNSICRVPFSKDAASLISLSKLLPVKRHRLRQTWI
jgi:hypothetical protein